MIITDNSATSISTLWASTATSAPMTTPLRESSVQDIVIIGGGYTGLSAALHLAASGAGVTVLESAAFGFGASGRNGGQVISGLKYDPDTLVKMFGGKAEEGLVETISNAGDVVFDLIAQYQIDCDAVRTGWIQPAHSQKSLTVLQGRARQWEKRGVQIELLDQRGVGSLIGTDQYIGGWLDPRGGNIQPLSYCLGLACAAQKMGAVLHDHSHVTALVRNGDKWRVSANGVEIMAKEVVIATNGYSGYLWPKLKQSLIAANSFILATKPLSDALGATILKGGQAVSDSRRLMFYYRKDREGRLLMGGRGSFSDPKRREDFNHLKQTITLLFPQLADVEYDFAWGGRIAITRDALPHIHEPQKGMTIIVGYNGRGVAMATTMGKLIAKRLLSDKTTPYPLPVSEIKPIPFHGLQRGYISAAMIYYSILDRFS